MSPRVLIALAAALLLAFAFVGAFTVGLFDPPGLALLVAAAAARGPDLARR